MQQEPDMGSGNKRCSAIRRVHWDIDGEPRLDLSYEWNSNSELTGVKMKVIVQEIGKGNKAIPAVKVGNE